MRRLLEILLDFIFNRILHLNFSTEQIEQLVQFVQFAIVGLSNTCISFIVYAILVAAKCHYLLASVIGFAVSVANAFYWNNKYVFRESEGEKRSMVKAFIKTFISYAGTGLILHNVLLILWINIFHMNQMIAPIINLFITIPANYILNKFWAFNK